MVESRNKVTNTGGWVRCWSLGLLLASFVLCQAAQANELLRRRMESILAGYPVAAAGETLLATKALPRFYDQRQYELAWSAPLLWQAMLDAIDQVAADGLQPEDYHRTPLARLLAQASDQPGGLTEAQRIDLDLLLTDAFLVLGSHLLDGKVNPETIDPEWVASRRQRDMVASLDTALANDKVISTLTGFRPAQAGYQRLVDLRPKFRRLLETAWPPLALTPSIRPQQTDPRVPEVRQRLELLGDLSAMTETSYADEVYGDDLQSAVMRFQSRHGLEPDGILGKDTFAALNYSPQQRLDQLDVNLERWRWLPDDLGDTYVMVNIAGFELELVAQGQVVERHRVVVGRSYRRSPVFSDQIRYLVFNPTWTVPFKLMVQDKLPEILQDPDYLNRLGFTVYKGWGEKRQQVDPATIDWASLSARYFPYQLVQEAGPRNALGQIKFMFPNKFNVYLHDTPSKELFQKTDRSFSSGCIRVENPVALAERLLAGTPGWNPDRIRSVLHTGEGQTVYLQEPVPVHLQYWTAWLDANGALQFRKDIYDRDARLLSALRVHSRDLR